MNNRRSLSRTRPGLCARRQQRAAVQLGAARLGAAVVGAAAVGAGAFGALAIGRLAVGRAVVPTPQDRAARGQPPARP
jgi:hypothetical protein